MAAKELPGTWDTPGVGPEGPDVMAARIAGETAQAINGERSGDGDSDTEEPERAATEGE